MRYQRITRAVNGYTYAWRKTRQPTNAAKARLWKKTYRKMSPSWPYHCVAVLATTMLWASIILPITPPALLAEAIRMGEVFTCCAVIFCRLPNSTLDDVSEPVSATPNHPSSVPKNGYK